MNTADVVPAVCIDDASWDMVMNNPFVASDRYALLYIRYHLLYIRYKIIYGGVPSTGLMPQRKTAALTAV